jgi:1,2-diacylglycerol-3-alpha-glucose alpha-1,2-galactosyltransferase
MQRYATSTESYNPLKINVCSETALLKMQGEGVNTAFVECAELLQERADVEVLINSQGHGDVMHSHTYGPYFFLKGLFYPKRKVMTVHVIPDSIKGSLPFVKQLMPFVRWYFKQVYSFADVLIAISPMVEEAIRELGVTTRVVHMANPLQIEKWKRTEALRKKGREILNLKDGEFCVMDVGQLQQRKGPEEFIEIGKKLPHIQFRWIGGRPFGAMTEGINRLNKKIEEAPSNIKFSGLFSLDDMPALYALLMHSSFYPTRKIHPWPLSKPQPPACRLCTATCASTNCFTGMNILKAIPIPILCSGLKSLPPIRLFMIRG